MDKRTQCLIIEQMQLIKEVWLALEELIKLDIVPPPTIADFKETINAELKRMLINE